MSDHIVGEYLFCLLWKKETRPPELSGLTLPLSIISGLNTLKDFLNYHFCESQNVSEHPWSRLYFP